MLFSDSVRSGYWAPLVPLMAQILEEGDARYQFTGWVGFAIHAQYYLSIALTERAISVIDVDVDAKGAEIERVIRLFTHFEDGRPNHVFSWENKRLTCSMFPGLFVRFHWREIEPVELLYTDLRLQVADFDHIARTCVPEMLDSVLSAWAEIEDARANIALNLHEKIEEEVERRKIRKKEREDARYAAAVKREEAQIKKSMEEEEERARKAALIQGMFPTKPFAQRPRFPTNPLANRNPIPAWAAGSYEPSL